MASGTTVWVRTAATRAAGAFNSTTVAVLSGGGAASNANVTSSVSGNSVGTATLTITGLSAANKSWDGNTTVSVTGTPAYSGLVNGESFSVTGTVTWAFPDANPGTNKTLTRTGNYAAPSVNYTVSQPSLTASIFGVPEIAVESPAGTSITSGGNRAGLGTVTIGSNADFVFRVANSGNGALSVTGITIGGDHASDFSLQGSPTFPVSIAAGASQDFTIRFSPGADGARTASVTFANDDSDEGSYVVNLTGTGSSSFFAPTVSSTAASLITATGATLNGTVSSDGGAAISDRGFVYSASDSTPTLAEGATQVVVSGTTGSLSTALTGLSSNTLYYFRAYAVNSVDTTYGDVLSFTTLKAQPAAHVTSLASGTITTANIPLTWSAADPAPDGYLLLVGTSVTDPTDGTAVADDTDVTGGAAVNLAGNATSYSGFTGFVAGSVYTFKAYPYNNSGSGIDYLVADAPSLAGEILPVASAAAPTFASVSSTGFTVNWSAVDGADSYLLDLSTASDFSSFVSGYENLSVSTTSRVVTGLGANTTYYARVRAVNTAGTGANSATGNQTTSQLSAPTTLAASGVSFNGFTANWNSVDGAEGYRVDVSFLAAPSTTSLIISEYVEGSSNNKYLEIYNGTGFTADLSDFEIQTFANGATTASNTQLLSALPSGPTTLAHGQTIVLAHPQAALSLPAGVTAYAAGTITPFNSVFAYNGDDAIALYKKSTASYVDIIGVIGVRPTTAWTEGSHSTIDKTLRRKTSVTAGISVNPGTFSTLTTEWDVYAQNTVNGLGSHSVPTFLSGFQNATAGNSTSLAVTGASSSTAYSYVVRATSANSTSANSDIRSVTTSATPIIIPTGSLSALTTSFGSVSSSTSFSLEGLNLIAGVTVTPPAGFEVSTTSDFSSNIGTQGSPLLVGAAGTVASTPIYVRLPATAAPATYSGNIVLSSTGADPVNVATVASTVSQATPTISQWPTATAITYGQTLADSTLSNDGAASVPGAFAFAAPSTVPNAGTYSANVTFTPTENVNYATVSTNVPVTVNKANPSSITWPTAAAINFGQALSAANLSGGASTPGGNFAYAAPTTVPSKIGLSSYSVVFTPSDTANYNTATNNVSVMVNQVIQTVYGRTDSQNFQGFTTDDLLDSANSWSSTDGYTGEFIANGFSQNASEIFASIGNGITTSPSYRMTYDFEKEDSDRLVFTWTQVIETSLAPQTAVDRFGWEFRDSSNNVLFALKMVQFEDARVGGTANAWDKAETFIDENANGIYDSGEDFTDTNNDGTWNPAEPLANPSNDQPGGYPNYVADKLMVAGYDYNGSRLGTDLMPNLAPIDRGTPYIFRVIVDLREDRWWAQIFSDGSFQNLMGPIGAPLPPRAGGAPAFSLRKVTALWELNDKTLSDNGTPGNPSDDTYEFGGSNVMLFDDFSIEGRKIVHLGLSTPSGAVYDGSAQGATFTDEGTGVAQITYSLQYSGVTNTSVPVNAGTYIATVGVNTNTTPYFAVIDTNSLRLYTNSAILTQNYTIGRKPVTITGVGVADKIYNGNTNATITGAPVIDGKVMGDNVTVAGAGTASFDTAGAGPVKMATISGYSLTGSAAANYLLTGMPISASAEIFKKGLTATADDQTREYLGIEPVFTISYDGFISGENASVLDDPPVAGYAGDTSSPPGSYLINLISGGLDDNYEITFFPGNLEITQALVDPNDIVLTEDFFVPAIYDGLPKSFSASASSSGPNFFDITYEGTLFDGTDYPSQPDAPHQAGAYTATALVTDPNYQSVSKSVSYTIDRAPQTIDGVDSTKSKIFGDAPYSLSAVATSMLIPTFSSSDEAVATVDEFGQVTIVGAGTTTITVSQAGNNNYESAPDVEQELQVAKADVPMVTFVASNITYGQLIGDSDLIGSSATGVLGENLTGDFEFVTPGQMTTGVGTQNVAVRFTPDSNNYKILEGFVDVVVNQATPSITWTNPPAITYGAALSSTQLNATSPVPGTFAYTPVSGTVLTVGTNTLTAVFTADDALNYVSPVTNTVTLVVNQATPVITWTNPVAITYGTALSSTQLNASSDAAGSFTYSPTNGAVLSVGTNTLTAVFTADDATNYVSPLTNTVTVVVNQATPAITWTNPAAITYGTALSSTQLNATSDVAGSFTYSPTNGSVLNAGTNTLTAVFTATDSTNYVSPVTNNVSLVVNKATQTITGVTATVTKTVGDASYSVGGTVGSGLPLAYSSSTPGVATVNATSGAVTILAPGSTTITVSQAGDSNYEAATSVTQVLTVNPATTPAEDYLASFGLTGANAALTADPDGDGLNNAQEFAFGAVPNVAGSLPITTSNTGGSLKMVFLGRTNGITYNVLSYTNLRVAAVSTNAPTASATQPTNLPAGYKQYEATVDSSTGTRKFMKVDAVIP